MPVKGKVISQDALAVLSACSVSGHNLTLPGDQLERKLYIEVNAVIEGIGGKWNKEAKDHVFAEPQEEMLEGCIQTGLAVPLSRNGYFPTPAILADHVVRLAELQDDDVILEPSAGTGALVESARRAVLPKTLIAIEMDEKNFKVLQDRYWQERWFIGHCADFLRLPGFFPGSSPNKVVMNPPFGNINGQSLGDITHIMHAWGMLKPGGRLVSIASSSLTFRREKKAVDFRAHVAKFGRFEELPEKSFKESGTLVKTIIVILDKP